MSGKRYPEEFKIEAVKQVVDRGYSVASVATRLDITTHSLYAWIKKYGPDSSTNKEQSDAQAEIRRLQKELKRVTGNWIGPYISRHLLSLNPLLACCRRYSRGER